MLMHEACLPFLVVWVPGTVLVSCIRSLANVNVIILYHLCPFPNLVSYWSKSCHVVIFFHLPHAMTGVRACLCLSQKLPCAHGACLFFSMLTFWLFFSTPWLWSYSSSLFLYHPAHTSISRPKLLLFVFLFDPRAPQACIILVSKSWNSSEG